MALTIETTTVLSEPETSGQEIDMVPDSTGMDLPDVNDGRKAGGGKAGSSNSSKKKWAQEKDSDEYKRRRERNNEAVRKSRQKSRQKASETEDKVTSLKKENADLEQRVTVLNKELELLKDLFLTHAQDLPDPSTTFQVFSKNPRLASSGPKRALSRVVLKTESVTVSLVEIPQHDGVTVQTET